MTGCFALGSMIAAVISVTLSHGPYGLVGLIFFLLVHKTFKRGHAGFYVLIVILSTIFYGRLFDNNEPSLKTQTNTSPFTEIKKGAGTIEMAGRGFYMGMIFGCLTLGYKKETELDPQDDFKNPYRNSFKDEDY